MRAFDQVDFDDVMTNDLIDLDRIETSPMIDRMLSIIVKSPGYWLK